MEATKHSVPSTDVADDLDAFIGPEDASSPVVAAGVLCVCTASELACPA